MLNPCCCCDIVAIIISNSNSAKDDEFEIKLNGFTLGEITNDSNTCTGRIFLMKVGDPLWPQAGEAVPQCGNILVANNYFCGSGVCNFMSPVTFSVSFLNEGENLLQIVVTANNNNGNFGLVKVLGLQQEGNNFKVCRTWLATTYSFETPSPGDLPAVGQSYLFDWSAAP